MTVRRDTRWGLLTLWLLIVFPAPAAPEDPPTAHERTRTEMLDHVGAAWTPSPEPAGGAAAAGAGAETGAPPLQRKLEAIVVPAVNFTNLELSRVVAALNAVAEQCDAVESGPRGVNIVLVDPANANPTVTITLRNLSLKRVLDLVTDTAGYQYEVQADAVVVRPGG
ncbi:MAG TPA: STN domain-containing protein, partial [Opitutaceae bacterium]|nr:STN domain-containing protein [Opitutaceae bacterium]